MRYNDLTPEQKAEYNAKNIARAKESRRLSKEVKLSSRPIQVNIYNSTPEMIAAVLTALESK